MTSYIFEAALGDNYDFQAYIRPVTYVIAGAGIFAVSVLVNDMMSRIIAHTGRNDEKNKVYTEIFDADGSEFYIEEHPEAEGKTLSELNRFFPVLFTHLTVIWMR